MRARGPVRPAVLLGLHVALFGAALVAQSAAEPSPLEKAKRELESAKGSRGQERDADLSNLKLAITPAPLQAAPAAAPVQTRPETGTLMPPRKNWLVDAMERKGEGRRGDSGITGGPVVAVAGRESEKDADDRTTDPASNGRKDRREDPRREESRAGGRREEEVNPFSRYLQDWVSPQDFALLQSTLVAGRSAAGEKSGELSGAAAVAGIDAPSARSTDAGLAAFLGNGSSMKGGPVASAKPTDNPFLQFLSPEASPARMPAQVPAANSTPSLGTPVSAPPPGVVPTRTTVPDFVRPTNDDKLYRTLKRF